MQKSVSNSIASAQNNPYLRSQTYFLKSMQVANNTRRMNRYQDAHSDFLAQPKR